MLEALEEGALKKLDHEPKRRKRSSTAAAASPLSSASSSAAAPMPKELTAEQKAVVKMNVMRESSEGVTKCCYCEKEITSKNVDRWASHLRGCIKTPDEVKAQIQPFRGTTSGGNASAPVATATAPGACPSSSGDVLVGTHPNMAPMHAAMHAQSMSVNANVNPLTGAPSGQLGHMSPPISSGYNEVFKVHVSKDYMKFNAAHFIAFKGFREKLHGHNYRVAVTITGVVGPDGYVVDFGDIKKISRVICKDLNESFLVPMNSDALKV